MKSGDGGPLAEDGGTAAVSSGSGNVDAAQVSVVGHVMESMPGCCDVIMDEQVGAVHLANIISAAIDHCSSGYSNQ